MKKKHAEIEERIGNTPLVRLAKLEEKYGLQAKLYAKAEFYNPAGSVKDRVAKAIVDDAEKSGRLQAGGTLIEATSGNTGVGLALIAATRGYKAIVVMPDSMSVERRKLIRAYGAEVLLTDGKKGMRGAVEKAEELLAATPNAIIADQFNNPVCARVHYETTGEEIYAQTQGGTDIFVTAVGTGGTLTGAGGKLKEKIPRVKIVAVEPKSSPLLSEGKAGAHGIQGVGANFVPGVLDKNVYDEVLTVTDEAAFSTARELCRTEGLFVGISSGANVAAAIALARRTENAKKTIVTILPDGGGRYLSTALFS